MQGGASTNQAAHSASGNWSAVIGSLPKGLTTDEKMKVKMSVPPSPSAALLKELNPVGGLTRRLTGGYAGCWAAICRGSGLWRTLGTTVQGAHHHDENLAADSIDDS